MKRIILILLLVISWSFYAQSTATYSLVFESNWSEVTHPSNNFPPNAHWSKLVGATHNNEVVFLKMGDLASPGIENVAELGNNTLFFSEINNAINDGFANQVIDGDALPTPLGSIVINNLETTEYFPLLSLITMIAPSPDWFVAVDSISLLDNNNEWENEIIINIFPYDAGTDNGTDYNSPNDNTIPQDLITSLQGIVPFSSEKIGTLTITLENVVLNTNEFFTKENIIIYPNPTYNSTTVSITNSTISSIEIYNILGKKIKQINLNNQFKIEIDFSNFSSGVYLLKIMDAFGKSTLKKLVKH